MRVSIIKAENLKPKPDETQLGFGKIYTDHMFNMDYHPERGWHDPRVEPYGPLVLDPATMFLHYAQGVFEVTLTRGPLVNWVGDAKTFSVELYRNPDYRAKVGRLQGKDIAPARLDGLAIPPEWATGATGGRP